MWIFPEGTRNKSEDPADLMEFREGSLKIAEKRLPGYPRSDHRYR